MWRKVTAIQRRIMVAVPRRNTMKSPDTAALKQQLLRQREALLQQLEQLRGGASRVDAASATLSRGEDSRAQVASEHELEMILDDREADELRAIDAALERIGDGSYGACSDCGAPIPEARLRVAPEAARCISCQTHHETGETGPAKH
jgi:DnaK suppressor protein